MSVKVRSLPDPNDETLEKTEYKDEAFIQRETTVDGYTFHWSPNYKRNFLDDGVGLAHTAFGTDGVIEDIIPNNDSRA